MFIFINFIEAPLDDEDELKNEGGRSMLIHCLELEFLVVELPM